MKYQFDLGLLWRTFSCFNSIVYNIFIHAYIHILKHIYSLVNIFN